MAIKLIDRNATIKFIPESEKGSENPTTFHVRPATYRDSLAAKRLYGLTSGKTKGKYDIRCTDDDEWLDYIASRIARIDNVADLPIKEILATLSRKLGEELFAFIDKNTDITETQEKK